MSIISSSHILEFCRGLAAERRISCQALHYWTEIKKNDKKLPRLDQIDFTDVHDLRDNLFILTTGNGGGRFVVLHSCEVLVDLCGNDPSGKAAVDIFPTPLNGSVVECCDTSIGTRQPIVGSGTLILENDHEIMYRMIILPLSENGKSVDHLVGAISFRYEN